jgi:hypothetical protein
MTAGCCPGGGSLVGVTGPAGALGAEVPVLVVVVTVTVYAVPLVSP